MNPRRDSWKLAAALILAGLATAQAFSAEESHAAATNLPSASAPATNAPAPEAAVPRTESGGSRFDESAFKLIAERNIFNANRVGAVRLSNSRRPAVVESFKLVGTMAYEKGAFAFFEGSNSEFTKAVKPHGLIANYKVVDILTDAVKLELDGKVLDLAMGAAMRREDNGAWHPGEAVAGGGSSSYASSRENGDTSRSSRSDRGDRNRDRSDDSRSRRNDSERGNGSENGRPATAGAATSSPPADQSEILKRLMERRERESR